jgi:hypothetical protein
MQYTEVNVIYNRLKASANKRNIEFTLTKSDLYELSYPISCPILGIPLQYNRGIALDNSYSIDRIDSTKGYVIDNIEVISLRANKLKSDATMQEIQLLAEYYKEKL